MPVTQLTDEELVKVVRERFQAKAAIFIYLDQANQIYWFTRWAGTKQGGDLGRRFCSRFQRAWNTLMRYTVNNI